MQLHTAKSTPLRLAPAHQLHINLVGARVQVLSTSLPLWEFKHRHAPL